MDAGGFQKFLVNIHFQLWIFTTTGLCSQERVDSNRFNITLCTQLLTRNNSVYLVGSIVTFSFSTVSVLRPVTNIYPGVEIETCWARHQDWSEIHTLVEETAVIGMRNKDSIAVLTIMADDIKVVVFPQRFPRNDHHQD